MPYAADSFSGASQMYNADQAGRRNALDNALSTLIDINARNKASKIQQGQFNQEMGLRKNTSDFEHERMLNDLALRKEDVEWRKALADNQSRREDAGEKSQANQSEFGQAMATAQDPFSDYDDSPYKTLNDAQRYTLHQTRKSALEKAAQDYQNSSRVADIENNLDDTNSKIDTLTKKYGGKVPDTIGGFLGFGKSPNPDAPTYNDLLNRQRSLQRAVGSIKNTGDYSAIDPSTLRYSPVARTPFGYATPTVATATQPQPQPFQLLTTVPSDAPSFTGVNQPPRRPFNAMSLIPESYPGDVIPKAQRDQINFGDATTSKEFGDFADIVDRQNKMAAGGMGVVGQAADVDARTLANEAQAQKIASMPAMIPAPQGSVEGQTIRQKSTGKTFLVRNGQLVPILQ